MITIELGCCVFVFLLAQEHIPPAVVAHRSGVSLAALPNAWSHCLYKPQRTASLLVVWATEHRSLESDPS